MTESSSAAKPTSSGAASSPRILVVGVGSIGERHVRCFQAARGLRAGQAQVGICEPNVPLREKIAATYKPVSAHASLDQALKQPWDSVVIATPAPLHVPMANVVIDAGVKHLLLEKPLSVTWEGVEALQAKVHEKNVKAGVAYVTRAHPAAAAMRQAIISGRFGTPVQLSYVSGQHFPFYRPAYASTYYAHHETGGGSIQDALTHHFDLAQWLVGPVTRIAALASHRVLATPEVEDTVNVLALHGDVAASYSQNQHQAVNEATVMVVCTRGVCRFQVHRHAWSWATEPGSDWHDEPQNFATRDDWFIKQCENWLQVMDGRREPDCTLDDAALTLKVNQAALLSAAEQGRWMEIV